MSHASSREKNDACGPYSGLSAETLACSHAGLKLRVYHNPVAKTSAAASSALDTNVQSRHHRRDSRSERPHSASASVTPAGAATYNGVDSLVNNPNEIAAASCATVSAGCHRRADTITNSTQTTVAV